MDNAQRVFSAVFKEYAVSESSILGPLRTRLTTKARHVAMSVLRREGWSYPQIGKHFNRDHSTVVYAVRKADPEAVERLYNAVKSAKVAEQSKETGNHD